MITLFMATVIGWYLVILSAFLLVRPEVARTGIHNAMNQPALVLILAVITLILGLIMVVSHNVWVMGWPLVVTLFSWLVLMVGLLRLFLPDVAIKMGERMVNHPTGMMISAIVFMIIGLFLLFMVYFGV